MGDGQVTKFFVKGRTKEFGMVAPTLKNPDVIISEASEAKDGKSERNSSYVFIKTFNRNGKKIRFYASITVKKDGMEVSVSSHYMNKNAVERKMLGGNITYIREALRPNSSDWHLAEHQNDVPDLLPTQGNNASAGKGTTKSPATNDLGEKNAKGGERININPTEGQKKAGNYKMGHVLIDGHKITIENPKGSTRSGKDANGKEWSVKMNYSYGYIRGTEGVDGDHVDVYLSDNPTQGNVYVVDQIDQKTGEFDEHKVMYGFPSMEAAVEAYKSQYEKGWKVGTVTEVSREDFKKWIDSSKRKTKPFSEYASVRNQKSGELTDANSKAAQSSDLSSTAGKGTESSAPTQETGGENSQKVGTEPTAGQEDAGSRDEGLGEWQDVGEDGLTREELDGLSDAVMAGREAEVVGANGHGYSIRKEDDGSVTITPQDKADKGTMGVERITEDTDKVAMDGDGKPRPKTVRERLFERLLNLDDEVGIERYRTQESAPADSAETEDGGKSEDKALAYDESMLSSIFSYISSYIETIYENKELLGGGYAKEIAKLLRKLNETKNALVSYAPLEARAKVWNKATELFNEYIQFAEKREERKPYWRKVASLIEPCEPNKNITPNMLMLPRSKGNGSALEKVLYHDGGYVVWTDDRLLYAEKKSYDKSLEGVCTDKDGNAVELEYPKWRDLLSKDAPRKPLPISASRLSRFVAGVRKAGGSNDLVAFYNTDGNILTYRAFLLGDFLCAASKCDAEVYLEKAGKSYRLLFESKNGAGCLSPIPFSFNLEDGDNILFVYDEQSKQDKPKEDKPGKPKGGKKAAEKKGKTAEKKGRKREERMDGERGSELGRDEVALRDALAERLRGAGVEVITDDVAGQEVLDAADEDVRLMGSRTNKRMQQIGAEMDGRELSPEEKTVADVFSGKADNTKLTVSRDGKPVTIMMRQGSETKAGTKHSVFRHYGTNTNSYTADEILRIPEFVENGKRSEQGGRVSYEYTDESTHTTYTVTTEMNNRGEEAFTNFYTNRKKQNRLSRRTRPKAHKPNNDNASSDAKVSNNFEKNGKTGENLRFFRTESGEAYGFTADGKIYLDPRVATAETPIHEYAHLWADALREANPAEWGNVVELMRGTWAWEHVQRLYPELTSDEAIADEALAHYSGRRGAERARAAMAEAERQGGLLGRAAAISGLERLQKALGKFWQNVCDLVGVRFTTAEEVADRVMADLLNGVKPKGRSEAEVRAERDEMAEIERKAREDGTYMKAPNGKPSNLSPTQWAQVRTRAFKEWFGDWEADPKTASRVLDENGEPRVVYHGTTADDVRHVWNAKSKSYDTEHSPFTVFSRNVDGQRNAGLFFNSNKDNAGGYGYNTYDVYLNLRNPLVIDCKGMNYSYIKRGRVVKDTYGWSEYAERKGYDGVVFNDISDGVGFGDLETRTNDYVAFSPNQIKSATENTGAFSAASKDIRHQRDETARRDADYLQAVERGDMETAQKMVDEAARRAGYEVADYQGRGSWVAPGASVERNDFENLDALRESVEEYGGDVNLYGIINGVTKNDDDFYYNPGRAGFRDKAANDTASVLRKLRYDKAKGDTKVKVYRAVPNDVRGRKLMAGDWVALSRAYCEEHGDSRYDAGNFHIVEAEVPISQIWNDGNDMREFGFDDGLRDAEKNVPNNRKLLDPVTYDNQGRVIPLSERFNEKNSDIRYQRAGETAQDVEAVNERFNEELQAQIDGKQEAGHVYQLGRPSAILRSTGFPDVPIELSATRLAEKAAQQNHEFEISEARNLVEALQSPIAVFSYGNKMKSQNAIVEIQHKGKNFVVGVHFNQERRGLVVSDIRGLFPKDNAEWLNWITQGKALYINKEKIQNLIDQQRTTLAEVEYLDLDSIAKVVETFENPTEPGKKLSDESENIPESGQNEGLEAAEGGDGLLFRSENAETGSAAAHASETVAGRRAAMADAARDAAARLGLDNVDIVEDAGTLDGRLRGKKGWYDPRTGRITVVADNHTGAADVVRTLLHEGMAHHGLRGLFGEGFGEFVDGVYENATDDVRAAIDGMAARGGLTRAVATEEYLAGLAERGGFDGAGRGLWERIKNLFRTMLRKAGLKADALTDADLRYTLWRSYENLRNGGRGGVLERAADMAKREELGIGNERETPRNWGKGGVLDKAAMAARGIDAGLLFRDSIEDTDNTARMIYDARAGSAWNAFVEAYQDGMRSVRLLQEAVLEQRDETLEDWEDAYNEENRRHGHSQDELEYFNNAMYQPLVKAVNEVAKMAKVSIGEVVEYMMAKSGLERNDVLARRDARADYERYEEKQRAKYDEYVRKGKQAYKEYKARQEAAYKAYERESKLRYKAWEQLARQRYRTYKAEHPNGQKTEADFLGKTIDDFKTKTLADFLTKTEDDFTGKSFQDFLTKTEDDFYDERRKKDYSGLTALTGEADVADAEAEAKASQFCFAYPSCSLCCAVSTCCA